jgi:arabinogalactan endo-1,4-beta-galactosidase
MRCSALLTLMTMTAALGAAEPPGAPAPVFLAGGDLSHLALLEQRGVVYQADGRPGDALALLKARGVNCVRLRLWTCTDAAAAHDPYGHGNTLSYTIALAKRVKQAGLMLLLDFHYSDTWADPAHQRKPADWEGLGFDALEQRMHDYSRDCIAALRLAGAAPDYVQIGNETPMGMVWPDGKVDKPEKWAQLARLIRAARQGIADAAGAAMPRIILHLDRGGDWGTTQWFFDALLKERPQPEFDIIAESYYPFWHGDFAALRTCLGNCVARYGKPVLVVETAFPWSARAPDGKPLEPINGIVPGPEGQAQFARELGGILAELPGHRGLGIVWWGAELVARPGMSYDGFDGRSFFDQAGSMLPVVAALGALAHAPATAAALEPK